MTNITKRLNVINTKLNGKSSNNSYSLHSMHIVITRFILCTYVCTMYNVCLYSFFHSQTINQVNAFTSYIKIKNKIVSMYVILFSFKF